LLRFLERQGIPQLSALRFAQLVQAGGTPCLDALNSLRALSLRGQESTSPAAIERKKMIDTEQLSALQKRVFLIENIIIIAAFFRGLYTAFLYFSP
jgi:hypothetical protein